MSYFLKFLQNLTDADLLFDITLGEIPTNGESLVNSPHQNRALALYNYLYEKEGNTESQQLAQLQKFLKENFRNLFIRKASLFKSNPTAEKFKNLISLLLDQNSLDLLDGFLPYFSKLLITNNLNVILIHAITHSSSDNQTKILIEKIITFYKLDRSSVFTNLIQLCELKKFSETKKFLTSFMGLKLDNEHIVNLIFNYALNPDFMESEHQELIKTIKAKVPQITSSEWRVILKQPERLANFKLNNKNFYNFFLKDCSCDILNLKTETGVYLLNESITSWDFLTHFDANLAPHQIFTYAIYIKKNTPANSKKSIIAILKEYLSVNKDLTLEDIIPQFPILWWGCGKKKKTYTSIKFWENIDLIPEIIPSLMESKAVNISQSLFGEKGTNYTKIITECLNDGAASGAVPWTKLAFYSLVNRILQNRDDFQALQQKLENTELKPKTYNSFINFFSNTLMPEIIQHRVRLFSRLHKETKFKLLTDNVDYQYLSDCFDMMNRLDSLKLDFSPHQGISDWDSYHHFLIEENQKIKVKGIKLNQEHLIPFFHNKQFIGMKIHVPLFSEDFVWAGESLGICVGTASYDKKVATKQSSIIFLLDGNKVKYVIEFNHLRIVQAKGNSNSNMNQMNQVLLKAFMKENWWNHPQRVFKNDFEYDGDYGDFEDHVHDDEEE